MTYEKQTVEYGGHGVDIKLQHPYNTKNVFWSRQGNSYVMVEADAPSDRTFRTPDGRHVKLLSINGIGEIRWAAEPADLRYIGGLHKETEDATEYFELEPSNG